MRLLIISDIHGDYESLYKVTKEETFDQLVILGDLFSYGFSDNKNEILSLLEEYKSKLILIKGNCDTLINYDALMIKPYEVITMPFNKHLVTFTHGNTYKKGFLPSYHGDIFISGHTHVPSITKEFDITYANPGSLGAPRYGTLKSYIIFSDNKITIKDLNKNIQKEMEV